MLVICPHTGTVQADAAAALRAHAPGAEYVDVSGGERAYGRAIAARWGRGDDLVIVEHDIEITPAVLPSFAACGELWCTYEYEIFAPPWTKLCRTGLGCTRFSAQFQQVLDFGRLVLEMPCGRCGEIHSTWGELDCRVTSLATGLGLEPHVHGRVRHFHPYLPSPADTPVDVKATITNITRKALPV